MKIEYSNSKNKTQIRKWRKHTVPECLALEVFGMQVLRNRK